MCCIFFPLLKCLLKLKGKHIGESICTSNIYLFSPKYGLNKPRNNAFKSLKYPTELLVTRFTRLNSLNNMVLQFSV